MRSVTYCCNESTIFKVGLTSTGSEGWFANKSGLAFAPVTAGQIGTKRIGSARLLEALVDINASGSFGDESLEAEALSVHALGVADTVEIAFAVGCHVNLKQNDGLVSIFSICRIEEKKRKKMGLTCSHATSGVGWAA